MGYIGQPLNAGNLAVQTGTGDGADTTPIATLNYSVGSSESLAIYLDGVKQAVSTYTASGTTLTFTTAPPNGVGIEVVFLALTLNLPTPGDSTVTSAKIVDGTIVQGDMDMTSNFDFTGTVTGAGGITLGTPVASTSGTSIDFTSIPAGTKRIVINFDGVSTNGTSDIHARLGDSGGIEATGYLGSASQIAASVAYNNVTTGLGITNGHAGTVFIHGSIVFELLDSSTFTWAGRSIMSRSSSAVIGIATTSKSLSAELDRVQITTVGGSDTFDAGNINISYE